MSSVDFSRIPPFYHGYVKLVNESDLSSAMEQHQHNLLNLLRSLPDDKWDYSYAPGKWTIKDLVQHLIDGERIFAYRALRFARKDTTPLPGFDENLFASTANAGKRRKEDLLNELEVVQKSSALLFGSFDEEQLEASGEANNNSIYVAGIGFAIVGHTLHHMNIIKERYL